MANILETTWITSQISPQSTLATFPTHRDLFGFGGLKVVENIANVGSINDTKSWIPLYRRQTGSIIFDKTSGAYYRDNGGVGTGSGVYTLLPALTTGSPTFPGLTSSAGILITNGANISFSDGGNIATTGTASFERITTSYASLGTVTSGTWNGSTIAVNKGGTGQTSYTDGQLLIGKTTGNTLEKATLTQGTGVSITNGAGSIAIAIGQSVATTVSPTFAGITLSNLTLNTLPIASTDGKLINSQITDNGSLITLGRATYVNGNFQANGTASATLINASTGFTSSNGYLKIGGAATSSTGFYSPGTSNLDTLNVTTINGSGLATFTNPITVSNATQAPFKVASTTMVTNLNADTVDGIHISQISAGGILYASSTNNINNVPLNGVLRGNNTSAPTAMTGTADRVTRWSNDTTIAASSTIYDNGVKVTVSVPFTASSGQITGIFKTLGATTFGNEATDIITSTGQFTASNGFSASSITIGSIANTYFPYSNNGILANSIMRQDINTIKVTGGVSSSAAGEFGSSVTSPTFKNLDDSFKVDGSGNLQCKSLKETSLRAYKHEIQYITESQLLNISKLKPVTFLYNQDAPQDVNDTRLRQAGFIAEQVQQIYPEVAWYKDGQLAGLQYQRLTAYLTKGIKQLTQKNIELQNALLSKQESISKISRDLEQLKQLVNKILQK